MIQSVLTTLFQVIVPLSIPVVAGILLVRFKGLEIGQLLTLVLYFLMPALIFQTLTTAEISYQDINQTVLFSLLNLLVLWLLAGLTAKILKLPAPDGAGLALISTLTNSVNYGLPLVLLALGKAGLDKATVYVVIQMIMVNTVGVYIAARSRFSAAEAMKSVFKLPAIYALILAIALRLLHIQLPQGISTGFNMVSQAYSPVVLAILGAQMAGVKSADLEREKQVAFWAGFAIRMFLSPVVSFACLYLLGIRGTLFSVLLILSSMPVAVNGVILAEKFDASPKIVSKCILWTTLFSFITLPILIVLVK